MILPEEFLRYTEPLFGPDRFARFMEAMDEEPPVSIRVNPGKVSGVRIQESGVCSQESGVRSQESEVCSLKSEVCSLKSGVCSLKSEVCSLKSEVCSLKSEVCSQESGVRSQESGVERVPWCPYGFYLPRRPNFTFDPLLHAGCYYVQEAASQFIVQAQISSLSPQPSFALDLCAAPGGKSTALRSVLPPDCLLVSNEPVRQRAQVLSENMLKWGHPNCVVTNLHARDFVRAGLTGLFDMIVCDVPCSGEGMFRKDPDSIGEWSTSGVMRCQQLQRQIVGDIWPCLRPGGVMVYSTCTYNTRENEENVRWICEQTGAAVIAMPAEEEWGIAGSLLQGFYAPVCRFIPGMTRSEGLFMAVLRKREDDGGALTRREVARKKIETMAMEQSTVQSASKDGAKRGGRNKGHDAPSCAEALSTAPGRDKYPTVELPYPTAIAYLRREAIVLPAGTPTGYALVTFRGHPLGFVKNIGSRANNLYPREWAIRSSHVPAGYEPVLPLTYRA